MILLFVYLITLLHMSLIWLWYRITDTPSVVDVGWASGLVLTGPIYLNQHPLSERTLILGLALALWGTRLGGYLPYLDYETRTPKFFPKIK